MPPRRSERVIADLLHAYGVGAGRMARAMAHDMGVHHTDMDAIEVLHAAPEPMTVSELGRSLQLSSAAVTAVVDRLEAAGHLVRVRDDRDRRRVHLHVTDRVHSDAMATLDPFLASLRRRLGTLSAAELRAAAAVLSAAVAALDEAGYGPSGATPGSAEP